MDIEIKALTPELAPDYFDFFDNRAFHGHEEWSCCYCTWFHMDKSYEKQIGGQVKADGGSDALRRALRGLAGEFLTDGTLHGYLAYDGGVAVGWCNANDKTAFRRFDFNAELSDFIRGGDSGNTKIKAITCFVIAPEYRGKGFATSLLKRVITDAHLDGYDAVEGYPRLKYNEHEPFGYNGPLRLYQKCGFTESAQKENIVIMRKTFD